MTAANKTDMYEMYIERLHDSAASGDVDMITAALKVLPDVNAKNNKGWTALMFAARNGQAGASKVLLKHGCDRNIVNSSGQTAADIARFWNHTNVIDVLSKSDLDDTSPQLSTSKLLPPTVNYFCGNPLNRMAEKRKDSEWISTTMKQPESKFILMFDLSPAVVAKPQHELKGKSPMYRIYCAKYTDISKLVEENALVVFLGVDETKALGTKSASEQDEDTVSSAWFAIDASSVTEEKLKEIYSYAEIVPLYPTLMTLPKKEAAIFSQARTLMAWHDRYQFCPTCGGTTTSKEGGYKRRCDKEGCRSNQGIHNTSYPRVDPTVIMAVISPDGQSLLLGRGKRFPKGMYSCLAGFMEPGESMEETCRREVFEESGIRVGRIDYHSCQPWPMPCSLMIGCLAYATSSEIQVDKDELDEAHWFSRQDVTQMLNREHPDRIFCPPEQAIAHQLIRSWVNMSSNL